MRPNFLEGPFSSYQQPRNSYSTRDIPDEIKPAWQFGVIPPRRLGEVFDAKHTMEDRSRDPTRIGSMSDAPFLISSQHFWSNRFLMDLQNHFESS
jgi:hypothetical protein